MMMARLPQRFIPLLSTALQKGARGYQLNIVTSRQVVAIGRRFSTTSHSEDVTSSNQTETNKNQNNHQQQQQQDKQSSASIREQILTESLKYVEELGWSNECLVRATKELGLPPLSHRIVRRGSPELVQFLMDRKRSHVQKILQSYEEEKALKEESEEQNNADQEHHHLPLDDLHEEQLKLAIMSHLEYIRPYRSSWSEAIAVSLDPRELTYSLPSLFMLIDDLCHFADIKTSRLDWYTERALMLYLYGTSELFLLTDSSENLQDTR